MKTASELAIDLMDRVYQDNKKIVDEISSKLVEAVENKKPAIVHKAFEKLDEQLLFYLEYHGYRVATEEKPNEIDPKTTDYFTLIRIV